MQAGKVHAVSFGADFKVQGVTLSASGRQLPVGVAYKEGSLYVSAVKRILRYDDIERRLQHPPAAVLVTDRLPGETHHGWKFIRNYYMPATQNIVVQAGAGGIARIQSFR